MSSQPCAVLTRLMTQWFPGTELDDVKRLLNAGRSSSVSPTRSSTHSTTLPVPRKATAEARVSSESSQTGSYRHTHTIRTSRVY